MEVKTIDAAKNRLGVWYGIAAFVTWGFLPLYWKLLQGVPPIEILYHRIFWSFIFMLLIVTVTRDWPAVISLLKNGRKIFLVFLAGLLVSVNWYIYIYAVNSDQVIESSMGYFINPLVVVLLGVTVFKEKLGRWQMVALVLAFIGVMIITVQYGRVPWIALILAASFALYGMVKKLVGVSSTPGLTLETLIIMPAALFLILRLESAGTGSFTAISPYLTIFLIGTGVITAIPLLLYARGIENTTFSMIGFLQYIAPTINLFLGVFVFKEYFSSAHLLSFCFIWAALIIFTLSNTGILKNGSK